MSFKLLLVSLSSFLAFTINTVSQPLTIQWQKCLGGSRDEIGYSIKQTNDSGYLIGCTASSDDGDVSANHLVGHYDYWVVKLDSIGNIKWEKNYGGSAEELYCYSIPLSDGGFIASGASGSSDGDVTVNHLSGDFWIIHGDSTGALLWEKSFGGSDEDYPYKLIQNYDESLLVTGRAQSKDYDVVGRHDSTVCPACSDAWVVKFDTAGNIIWSKCYGGYYAEIGRSIAQTADSGFILAASAMSDNGDVTGLHAVINGGGLEDYWVVKVDSIGNIQWQKCFGGSWEEIPYDIIQTEDKGYIVIGTSMSDDYDVAGNHDPVYSTDAWIVKMDSMGNMQWQKCLGGTENDIGKKIIQLDNSNYLALCYTASTDGDLTSNPPSNFDVWLIGLDQSGNIQWQQCMGGSFVDAGYDIQQTSDGGAILIGLTESNDGDVSGNHGWFDVWVVKLGLLPDEIIEHPNPISEFSTFTYHEKLEVKFYSNKIIEANIQLYDITGRKIFNQKLKANSGYNNFFFSLPNLSNGVYLAELNGVINKIVVK